MKKVQGILFWPLLVSCAAFALLALKSKTAEADPVALEIPDDRPFDILVTKLVKSNQKYELLEVDFEHWQMQDVSVSILEPGLVRNAVMSHLPKAVLDNVLGDRWNHSTAQIVTHCRAQVEFEVDLSDTSHWRIRIDGDTAHVSAPPLLVDDVRVRTDTVRGWVIREDWLVDGKKQKELLLKNIQRNLQKKVRSTSFLNSHREACRRSLVAVMCRQLQLLPETRTVKHVYVSFADDPETGPAK